ncbi:uncharacterized protein LOC101850922 [Aplysia californica]|uniref:Uncharacterized protein LOC101850922 n=1 Tax=Aplysia californica TaxID=6500 RepID=A0ABM0JBM8_APLCA|nr:uncharacterized protein LOC101850922 [Aplysia californica]XP_005089949.1 uncharacterized protein LOC101850922 [Aplysia californica]
MSGDHLPQNTIPVKQEDLAHSPKAQDSVTSQTVKLSAPPELRLKRKCLKAANGTGEGSTEAQKDCNTNIERPQAHEPKTKSFQSHVDIKVHDSRSPMAFRPNHAVHKKVTMNRGRNCDKLMERLRNGKKTRMRLSYEVDVEYVTEGTCSDSESSDDHENGASRKLKPVIAWSFCREGDTTPLFTVASEVCISPTEEEPGASEDSKPDKDTTDGSQMENETCTAKSFDNVRDNNWSMIDLHDMKNVTLRTYRVRRQSDGSVRRELGPALASKVWISEGNRKTLTPGPVHHSSSCGGKSMTDKQHPGVPPNQTRSSITSKENQKKDEASSKVKKFFSWLPLKEKLAQSFKNSQFFKNQQCNDSHNECRPKISKTAKPCKAIKSFNLHTRAQVSETGSPVKISTRYPMTTSAELRLCTASRKLLPPTCPCDDKKSQNCEHNDEAQQTPKQLTNVIPKATPGVETNGQEKKQLWTTHRRAKSL